MHLSKSVRTPSVTVPKTTATATLLVNEENTTKKRGPIPLTAVEQSIKGVHNASIGGDSTESTAGGQSGQYMPNEYPAQACDDNVETKYLHFGSCSQGESGDICGLNTGFYFELERGSTLVNGLRICTANDLNERDPTIVSLEGSNLLGMLLISGNSWTLLYNGTSGLDEDPGRSTCGPVQIFNNTNEYKSYRFLVSEKRNISNSVQYSEVQLYNFEVTDVTLNYELV